MIKEVNAPYGQDVWGIIKKQSRLIREKKANIKSVNFSKNPWQTTVNRHLVKEDISVKELFPTHCIDRIRFEPVGLGVFMLIDEVVFEFKNDWKLEISSGFFCDGASIPKFAWSIIGSPLIGKYLYAALLHDALYAGEIFNRSLCDDCFLYQMKHDGVSWWKRNLMYSAVRAFGGGVWDKHTEGIVESARNIVFLRRDNNFKLKYPVEK